jgi:thiol-disulfide isomerase/thioredoxin
MFSFKSIKRFTTAIIALVIFSLPVHASGFEKIPFDKPTFDQLQAKGETILVDIYATWCPTCKKQQQVLNDYFTTHPKSNIKVLVVDFDVQKEWVKYFKAPRQSSLYLFKGQEQVWFSVAETREQKIFSALNSVSK